MGVLIYSSLSGMDGIRPSKSGDTRVTADIRFVGKTGGLSMKELAHNSRPSNEDLDPHNQAGTFGL